MTDNSSSQASQDKKTAFMVVYAFIRRCVTLTGEFVHVCVDVVISPVYVAVDRTKRRYELYKARKAVKEFDRPKHVDDQMKRAEKGKYSIRGLIEAEKSEVKE